MEKKLLRDIIAKTPLMDFHGYREYLAAIYNQAKSSNDKYSYLDLAEALGFNRTNVVWMFITGRRAVSDAAAKRICKHGGITGQARLYFLAMVKFNNARDPGKRENLFQKLVDLKNADLEAPHDQQTLEYFSEWYHPVLRELTKLPGFKPSPEWVNQHLYNKILPKKIDESFQLLQSLELVQVAEGSQQWQQGGGEVTPGRAVEKLSAVRFHQKMLEVAKESVTRVPSAQRDLNAVTFTVSPASFHVIKRRIRELCAEILQIEAENPGVEKSVYQFNAQLFALSKDTLR